MPRGGLAVQNPIKTYWNNKSDNYFANDVSSYDIIKEKPEMAFPAAIYPLLQKYIGNLHGKKVLVPSSGDNVAAFGLHLLGAKVTSCDLAENQLANAQEIAQANGWNIEFLCQDTMTLDKIGDNEYDLVYTSNGVHVWINDMPQMYRTFHRVLKKGGYNIFFETHPISRPFKHTTYEMKIKRHYTDTHAWANDEVPNYLWRTQDFVNAVISSGLTIKEMQEFHSQREDLNAHNYLLVDDNDRYNWPGDTFDWKNNPWAALPQCLCLCSQK